jgi:predicted DNA-binding transcriptional regulator AlpA
VTGLTVADLRNLPPTIDLMTAARALGIGRTKAYELARSGEFPCRIIRIGDLYRVATPDLIRLLGSAADIHEMPPKAS